MTQVDSWLHFVDTRLAAASASANLLRDVAKVLENALAKNKEYFVGKSLTVADIAIWVALRCRLLTFLKAT